MRIIKALLPAALAVAIAACAMAQSNLPRNSYLEKRVNTTADLIQQIQTQPEVMDRYRRHFAMTGEEVVSYLTTLRVSALSKDGVYTVYGVPHSSGDFHAHLRLLKKGEPVFVEQDGTPVLQVVCGNPLVLGPKKPVTPNPLTTTAGPVEGTKDVVVDAPPSVSPATPVAATPGVDSPPAPLFPPTKSSSNIVPMLLGLAGAVGIFPHHGHTPPVPEPFSMLILGGGIAAMAARRRTKRA